MEKRNIVIILFACVFVVLFGFCIKNNIIKTAVAPITYTKEFTYLPSQKTMTVKSSTKPTKTMMGVSKYILKNKKTTDAIDDYEKVLTTDGWKITVTKNPTVISAVKGSHVAAIVPTQIGKDVQFSVASK